MFFILLRTFWTLACDRLVIGPLSQWESPLLSIPCTYTHPKPSLQLAGWITELLTSWMAEMGESVMMGSGEQW